jgi:hypothetical protein
MKVKTKRKLHTMVSDPKGQSHLTAVGVFLIMEAILGLDGQSVPENGGLFLPDTLLLQNSTLTRLKEFGITIVESESQ